MPSRTNLTAGIPSSKVKYSKLSSTDDGYIDLQVKSGKENTFLLLCEPLGKAALDLCVHGRLLFVHLQESSLSSEQYKASCKTLLQPFSSRKPVELNWEQDCLFNRVRCVSLEGGESQSRSGSSGCKCWLSWVSMGRIPRRRALTEPRSTAAATACPVSPLLAVGFASLL